MRKKDVKPRTLKAEIDHILKKKNVKKSMVDRLIMYFSRGNVALQSGHYVTAEDKVKLRKKVVSHKFI